MTHTTTHTTTARDTEATTTASLADAFAATVRARGDQTALRTPEPQTPGLTWREYALDVARYATGFRTAGVAPGDTVGLMMANRPEAYVLDTAVLHCDATPFSIYNTSSAEQIAHIIEVARPRCIVVERDRVPVVERARSLVCGPCRPEVFTIDDIETATLARVEDIYDTGVNTYDLAQHPHIAQHPATLIFTSGTTGAPKAAELTHANILAACRSVGELLHTVPADARYLSYLPMANIGERMTAYYLLLYYGGTATAVKEVRTVLEYLPSADANIVLLVPRTWDTLVERAKETGIRLYRNDFTTALDAAKAALARYPEETLDPGHDALLAAVRTELGLGSLVWPISGSAPIGRETLEFFAALGVRICEGYGLSEVTGWVTSNPADRPRIGKVGRAFPGVELKTGPDNELLCRSAMVMRGYRNNPEATAAVIDPDGWFHTGDLVEIDDDGYVAIKGRIKEIIINTSGKNMNPGAIEQTIRDESTLITQIVCVGDGRPYNTAIVTIDPTQADKIIDTGSSAEDDSLQVLVEQPAIIETVAAAIERGNAKLSRVEHIRKFVIVPETWMPDGMLLTQNMKIRRSAVIERYADEIESMYADTDPGNGQHEIGSDRSHRVNVG
jgi:long-subunit acyl-CoA synthetase (AMP-forming)